jgi:hypothetical protein
MKTTTAWLFLALLFAAASASADEPKSDAKKSENAEKKGKSGKSDKSDKNAAQKAEASVTKWANDNKIWITHPDKSGKKSEK